VKILRLESENVKRLHAVEIAPNGDIVIVAGNNNQGKTSVLDSIEYALAGKRAAPSRPVREGEDSARIVCDLGDIIVKRVFKKDGKTSLTVENRDGDLKKSPQALLDGLVGELSFDPLEFLRMSKVAQVALLKTLGGLDFAELDAEREAEYARRTENNRAVKSLASRLEDAKSYPELPAEEISVSDLLAKNKEAQDAHRDYSYRAKEADDVGRMLEDLEREIAAEAEALEKKRKKLESSRASYAIRLEALKSEREKLPDTEKLRQQLDTAEETNRKIRANSEYNAIAAQLEAAKGVSENLTKRIQTIDSEKREALAKAKLPITGLSLDGDEVTYEGVPFEQASSSQQLRVSLAMGMALNPKLRVLLIRDGSLLDETNLSLIAHMAAEHDCQVWIERVGKDGKATVVIEDGEVSK